MDSKTSLDDISDEKNEKREKMPWGKRHPVLSALLVTASNVFSLVFFVGFESFVLLDFVPILVCLVLTNGAILAVWPYQKWMGEKPPLWKKIAGIPVVVAGVALFVLAFAAFGYYVLPPVTISPETTYLTEPRRDDGLIDYRRYLEDRILGPPETWQGKDNGYRALLVAFGKAGLPVYKTNEKREEHWNELCRAFELDPDLEPTHRRINWKIGFDKERVGKAWERPWTIGEFPDLACWIAEQNEVLELFAAALRAECFIVPPAFQGENFGEGFSCPAADLFRDFSNTLRLRALLRIGSGETEKAREDIETLYRLATGQRTHSFNSDWAYINSDFESKANEAAFFLVRDGGLDVVQLQNFRAERLKWIASMDRREAALLWRLSSLTFMQYLVSGDYFRKGEEEKRSDWEVWCIIGNIRYAQWNRAFRQLNAFFDRLDARLAEPGYFELEELEQQAVIFTKRLDDEIPLSSTMWIAFKAMLWKGQTGFYPALIAEMQSGFLVLEMQQSHFESFHRIEAMDGMVDLAILLECYRREHGGRYPETLDVLTAEGYSDELPVDPFSRHPKTPAYERRGFGYEIRCEGRENFLACERVD